MKTINLNEAVEQYKALANQIAILEAQKEAVANHIKQVMGEVEELLVGDYIVRYKNVTTNRFDTTSFKKTHADLYADYLKACTSRRFTVA